MTINIVNIKNSEYDVYIGRGSKWGNPFKIGKHGNRHQVILLYKEWIMNQSHLLNSLNELENKTLGCHCYPKSCHGDILKEIVFLRNLIS